ncbi:MJ0042 family finger-like domain-containing protein [Fibrobacter sp. UWH5]|uniref:MJ0042-type zinc finger domain-containing protein n=1 Tax=Fibrobacter sp. UWH5 TaxID=1896211 RepID=UPI000923B8DE|nr:MJ0042-type zinc finger domain-containing protein [Fibrobacter sp. UWH5]SHK44995.1 MJ0042 family finger-like domain-containing protein [Fibrobacter sp. UWH5]
MEKLHIDCPHCGASFDVELQGEKANMMVFCCARCKTPLMYCHGEVGELDRDEFANLRKKLSRAIEAAVSRDGSLAGVADALRQMVDASNAIAEEREPEPKAPITDESLAALQKELDEMDAESFLDQL